MRADVDAELLKRLDERDLRGAASLLVEGYADAVVGLCRAMVRDATVAEDLSQDVFSNAFRALATFRGDALVKTWILRIARNRCVDYLRAVRRRPFIDDEVSADEQPTAEPHVDDLIMRREDVHRGLDALAENERALVMLRFGHELGYAELAATFGLSEGAARMRISRAVAKMREAISAPTPRRARTAFTGEAQPDAAAADLELPTPMSPSAPSPLGGPMPPGSAPPPLGAPAAPKRAPAQSPFGAPSGAPPPSAPAPMGAPLAASEASRGGAGSPERRALPDSPFATAASSRLLERLRSLAAEL